QEETGFKVDVGPYLEGEAPLHPLLGGAPHLSLLPAQGEGPGSLLRPPDIGFGGQALGDARGRREARDAEGQPADPRRDAPRREAARARQPLESRESAAAWMGGESASTLNASASR